MTDLQYPKSWKFFELPPSERAMLEGVYGLQPTSDVGYSPYCIQTVRELDEAEQRFFANRKFMSANFITQVLYKLHGELKPVSFNSSVRDLINQQEILRTNYCSLGTKVLAVIFQERRDIPPIVYQNLAGLDNDELETTLHNIMEADMRLGFDIRSGNLLRFHVFHTGEDEYAILVTAVHLVLSHLSMQTLFARVQGLSIRPTDKKTHDIIGNVDVRLEQTMKDYWQKLLQGLSVKPQLPYTTHNRPAKYHQRVYRFSIPKSLMSDLRSVARSNKLMLMAVLQTAWAFLLQGSNNIHDLAICTLLKNPTSKMEGLQLLPLRLKNTGELTVEKTVDAQFKQLLVSQPYGLLGWEGIQDVLGTRYSFDHFLSFYDFMGETTKYTEVTGEPFGKIVTQNSWDAQGVPLGLYFRYEQNKIVLSLMYNENAFLPQAGEGIAALYLKVLQQMIADWNLSAGEYLTRLADRLDAEAVKVQEHDSTYLRNLISTLEILQSDDNGVLQLLTSCASAVTLFEGDRLYDATLRENLAFVSEGRLERSFETGDGWYNTLDILKKGDWVNETIFIPNNQNGIAVTVLTEQAVVLLIPLKNMQSILIRKPQLWSNFMTYALKQIKKYRKLWIMG